MKAKDFYLYYDTKSEDWVLCDRSKSLGNDILAHFYDGDTNESPLGKLLLEAIEHPPQEMRLGVPLALIIWGILFLGIPALFQNPPLLSILCSIAACLCLLIGSLGCCIELFDHHLSSPK